MLLACRLALISTHLPLELLTGEWGDEPAEAALTLSAAAPFSSSVQVRLSFKVQGLQGHLQVIGSNIATVAPGKSIVLTFIELATAAFLSVTVSTGQAASAVWSG